MKAITKKKRPPSRSVIAVLTVFWMITRKPERAIDHTPRADKKKMNRSKRIAGGLMNVP
jgi:hypothetical protein